MLNALGLGIMLTMRDYASMPAGRVQRALLGLDNTAHQFSMRYITSMYKVREGMNMLAMGSLALSAPFAALKMGFETQNAMMETVALGIQDYSHLLEQSLSVSNRFAKITRENYMQASYFIKSGLFWLSDEDVAKYTANATITAKATKSTTEEMAKLFAQSYGIFKGAYKEMSDAKFVDMLAGGMTKTVQMFRTTGHEMSLALNTLNSDATAAGYTMERQLAILGVLQQSMPGRRAGTRLRAFIHGAVKAATEFNYPLVDAQGHLLSIADMIDNIKTKIKDPSQVKNIAALRKAFESREAYAVLQNLWDKTDQLRAAEEEVRKGMMEGMSLVEKMAYVMDKNLGAQVEILKQRFKNLGEIIGESISKGSSNAVAGINLALLGLQKFVELNPKIFQLWASLSMTFGVLLIVAGAIRILTGGINLLADTLWLTITRFGLLFKELRILAPTFGPAIAAVIGLYLAFKYNFMGIRDLTIRVGSTLKNFGKNTILALRGLWELVSSLNSLRYGMISAELKWALEQVGLWGFVKSLFMAYVRIRWFLDGFKEGFMSVANVVMAIVVPAFKILVSLVKVILTPIVALAKALGWVGSSISQSNINIFEGLGKALGAIVGPLLALKGAKAVFNSFKGVATFFKGIGPAREAAIKLVTPTKKAKQSPELKKALQSIKNNDKLIKEIGSDPLRQKEANLLKKYNERMRQKHNLVTNAQKHSVKTQEKVQQGFFKRMITRAKNFPKNFINGIKSIPKRITAKIKDTYSRITNGVKKTVNTIKNIGTGLKNFAKTTWKYTKLAGNYIKTMALKAGKAFASVTRSIGLLVVRGFRYLTASVLKLLRYFGMLIRSMYTLALAAGRFVLQAIVRLATACGKLIAKFIMLIATNPFVFMAVAIIVVIFLIYKIAKNWDIVKEKFMSFARALLDSPIGQAIMKIGEKIKEYIIDPLTTAWEKLKAFLNGDRGDLDSNHNKGSSSPNERSTRRRPIMNGPINSLFSVPVTPSGTPPVNNPYPDTPRNSGGPQQSIPPTQVNVHIDGKVVAQAVANHSDREQRRRSGPNR